MLIKTIILLLAATAYASVPPAIYWPCNSVECIARELAARSTCNPHVRGFVPNVYRLEWFRFDTPNFNATYIDNDLYIKNQDKCYISQFYYNRVSKKMVLGIDCPMLELQSTRTVIQHYSLREDVIYDYCYQGTYPLIRMTTVMSLAKPLDLCNAFTFTDVTALPLYRIKPNNPLTAKVLATDDDYLNIFERETFFWRGNQLSRFFINSILCDFGCNF